MAPGIRELRERKVVAKKRVFMVMPLGDPVAKIAYLRCVTPVCEEFDLDIRNAIELFTNNVIYDDIVAEIEQATIIICDISGKNPNVLYELGIAHTLKKDRTIIITQDEFSTAPFDVHHFRMFRYTNDIESAEQLKESLRGCLTQLMTDLSALYQQEFELTLKILDAAEQAGSLLLMVALPKINELTAYSRLSVEGEIQGNVTVQECMSALHAADVIIRLGHVEAVGGRIILTEKGKAFALYLAENGVVCHVMNDESLTPGYKSRFGQFRWKSKGADPSASTSLPHDPGKTADPEP